MYTDATGALPVVTLEGNHYYLVAYAYDPNYIFAIPIKNLKNESILEAFEQVFQELKDRGFKPSFNVTDNQATKPIKEYLKKEQSKWQFVEPNNHRVNAAERAIQTFKNHFISGLCSTDRDWPLQLWDQLTEQALITLNLLRTSRIDPTKSAYHQMYGHKYDWNAHPLAPPGTKAVIYESTDTRTSWGNRGLDAWYCGPAMDHYRNSRFYVPATKSYRTSGSFDLFPQHCILPTFTPEQHVQEVHRELFESVQMLSKPAKRKFLRKIAKALEVISNDATEQRVQIERSEGEIAIQRVEAPPVTTINNSTDPKTLATKPRTHERLTRNNTPGSLPIIENPEHQHVRRSKRLANPEEEPIITVTTPSSSRIPVYSPNIIAFNAVNHLTEQVYYNEGKLWYPGAFLSSSPNRQHSDYDCDVEHMCAGVTHPVTGETITKYKKLIAIPEFTETWETAFGKEFGNQAQGDNKTGEKGTNTLFVMDHEQIANIPKDRTVTYGRIVIDYRPQKSDPNRVRITAGGNLITDYPGEVTTRTADLTTAKILWNSVISTEDARFMGIDIKSFFITATLDRYEYMKMPLDIFPRHIRDQYDLDRKAKNGYVYLEIRRAIYGLPQSGALANKLLRKRLAPFGYYEVPHTPGLWRHVTRPISFSLVVDDFGVKYVGKEHALHLVNTLKKWYQLAEDWEGKIYCGITLDWHYDERYVDLSIPTYIPKVLTRFGHKKPSKPQHNPYKPFPRKLGKEAQDPLPVDDSERLDLDGLKRVQQIVGSLLFYARAVDNTLLIGLSAIASEQANPTQRTKERCDQLLDYVATHPNATVRFRASNMILNIHSDASYLSEPNARSRIAGHYFLGDVPTNDTPIQLNGAILVFCGILKFVVASAAEAELGALFLNCKEGKILRLVLQELGHKQPPTPVHCDNATAAGIANDTVKKQRSRSMEMRFFWVTDQVKRKLFDVRWHPGQENLADYFTKHFETQHHIAVRPWYLHTKMSPTVLPRAAAPKSLRGCVGTLPDGYLRTSPLPRIDTSRYQRVPLCSRDMGLHHSQPVSSAPTCV